MLGYQLNKDYYKDIACNTEAGYIKCWDCGKQSFKKKELQRCRCCNKEILPCFEKGDVLIYERIKEAIFQKYEINEVRFRLKGIVLIDGEAVEVDMKKTKKIKKK